MCLSVVEIRFGKEQHVDVYGMVVKDIGLGVFGVDVEAVGIEVFGWAAEALEMALEMGGLGGLVMGFGSSSAASQGQSMQLDADPIDYATCTPTDDFPSCARPPPAPAAQPTTGMAYDGHAQGEEITQAQTLTALFTMPVVHIMIHTLEQVGIYLYSMALCVLHTNSRLKKKDNVDEALDARVQQQQLATMRWTSGCNCATMGLPIKFPYAAFVKEGEEEEGEGGVCAADGVCTR